MIDILGLVIAALGGTAVGVERQWSGHADGADARFAGVRTFTLLGGLGGLAGWLWTGRLHASRNGAPRGGRGNHQRRVRGAHAERC